MFDVQKFSEILQKISDSYNSISEFSEASEVNRTYLSKYINKKLSSPPSPKVLMKISNNSNKITTYEELMEMCGYITNDALTEVKKTESILNFENMLKKLHLTYLERKALKLFELDFQRMINEGLSIKEIEKKSMERIDSFSPKEYNIKKLKKAVETYIVSIAANTVINHIYNQQAEIDTKLNYIDAVNKIKALKEDLPKSNIFPLTDTPVSVPILGKISAGLPILATENIEGYEFAPSSYIKEGFDYFYLRVNGDSMNLKFNDGDIVLVQKQDNLENDEIGVILINEMDATVKKYKYENGLVILSPMSTNSEHVVQIYNPKDISIKIIGKVVSYQGKI